MFEDIMDRLLDRLTGKPSRETAPERPIAGERDDIWFQLAAPLDASLDDPPHRASPRP